MSMRLEGFPVAEIDGVMRRTLWSSVAVGILAVGAGIGLGYPLFGPGAVIGLGLGLLNNRVFQVSAARNTTPEGKINRGPFASATFLRLGAVTAVALLLLLFVRPMGWGVIAGLAIFQPILSLHMLKVLLAFQKGQSSGGLGA
ncbi:MAG TPA: hypothetical protein VMU63_05180 [Acidimicrobiales bacterium]|nr:hypothetical protein [Acidimicrobiales bacterium]